MSSTGNAPVAGRRPLMPLSAAGMRIDPIVSVPSAMSASPAATAAPEPPLEPPTVRETSQGLAVRPKCGFSVVMPQANSCVFVLPITSAPPARSAATTGASRSGSRRKNDEPARVGSPATSMMSLTARVRPCSGPRSAAGIASSRAASRSTIARRQRRNSEAARPSRRCGQERSRALGDARAVMTKRRSERAPEAPGRAEDRDCRHGRRTAEGVAWPWRRRRAREEGAAGAAKGRVRLRTSRQKRRYICRDTWSSEPFLTVLTFRPTTAVLRRA